MSDLPGTPRAKGADAESDAAAVRLPLTSAQEALWFAHQLDPHSRVYNIAEYVDIRGALDPERLRQAVAHVTREVDAMRVTFPVTGAETEATRCQVVHEDLRIAVPLTDLTDLAPSTDPAAPTGRKAPPAASDDGPGYRTALARMREDLAAPVDPARGPLIGMALYRLAPRRHLLYLRVHHLALDGFGAALLLDRIAEVYGALDDADAGGPDVHPLPLAALLEDGATYRASDGYAADEAYWRDLLADAPAPVRLSGSPATAAPAAEVRCHSAVLPADRWDRLRGLAREAGLAWPALFAAATAIYVHRLSGAPDLLLGLPVSGRRGRTARRTPGMMSQVLPLRVRVGPAEETGEVVRRVAEGMRHALRHQRYPAEALRSHRGLRPGEPLTGPAVNVLAFDGGLTFGSASASVHNLSIGPVEDLTVAVHAPSSGDEARVDVLANAAVYGDEETAAHLGRLLALLEELAADLARPVGSLTTIGAQERRQALALGRGPDARGTGSRGHEDARVTPDVRGADPSPAAGSAEEAAASAPGAGPRTVPEELALRAGERPGDLAVTDGSRQLVFAELDAAVEALAARMCAAGAARGERVAVALPRSVDLVVTMLAVLRSGAVYVPIDLSAPAERVGHLLTDAAPAVLVCEPDGPVAGLAPAGTGVLSPRDAAVAAAPARPDTPDADSALPAPSDPAYLIYTSGSTGRPKGVLVEHRSLSNLLDHHRRESHAHAARAVGRRLRVALTAATSFDASWDPVLWMLAGHELHVVDDMTRRDPEELVGFLRERRVDVIETTPSFLWQLLAAGLLPDDAAGGSGERDGAEVYRPVVVALGGEPVNEELWQRLSAAPGVLVYNFYGPTETTVDAVTTRVHGDLAVIGRPAAGIRAYVLDSAMHLLPRGAVGELYLAGEGVALGYAGRTGLTAARFLADPFVGHGARMYRTGDLVRWREDGSLEFFGRSDAQIKIRGMRVETGEIESALVALPGVAAAAVVLRRTEGDGEVLAAYLVPEREGEGIPGDGDPLALRESLAKTLPAHMVPAAYATVERLPLTPNGKLDPSALPAPRHLVSRSRAVPRTDDERLVCSLMARLLGVGETGRDDDFFTLGGHSLLAPRLLSHIHDATGVRLPVRALFEAPTPAGLAAVLADARDTSPPGHTATVRVRPERLPLSPAQHRLWLLERMGEGGARYHIPLAVRLTGPLDVPALQSAFTDLLARHESLRTLYPEAPETTEAPESDEVPGAPACEPGPYQLILPVEECGTLRVTDPARHAASAPVDFRLDEQPPVHAELVTEHPDGGVGSDVASRTGTADGEAPTHLLLLTLHHIVADGWSMGPLLRDLSQAYAARCRGQAPAWEPLPVQYADYALRRHAELGLKDDPDSLAARQLGYWRDTLASLPQEVTLPLDRPRPARSKGPAASVPLRLDQDTHRQVAALAQQTGTSTFMVLHAAVAGLLTRLGAGEDVVLGTPVAGRADEDLAEVVGFFVNTLVLRTDTGGDPAFRELLRRVRARDLAAYAHQDVPFEQLVEELKPPRSLSRHPLFQVMLALNNTEQPRLDLPGLRAVREDGERRRSAKFDLTWDLTEEHGPHGAPAGLTGEIEFSRDLFDQATVERFARHFTRLLAAALRDPDLPLSALEMLSDEERDAALDRPAPTGLMSGEHAPPQSVCDILTTQAIVTPARSAVVDAEGSVTFGDVVLRADAVAARLAAAGVGRGDRVAVALPRTARQVAALFGVLRAGGVYVPLDPLHPAERNARILGTARPAVLLTERSCAAQLPASPVPALFLDETPEIEGGAPLPPLEGPRGTDPAYVLYTSGSTGRPKGVVVEHRALVNLLRHHANHLISPAERANNDRPLRVALTAAATFDASWDPLLWMVAGHELHLVDDATRRDPEALVAFLHRHRVDVIETTPSFLEQLRAGGLFAPGRPWPRVVALGGEAVNETLWNELAALDGVRVWNLYGPTETTVDSVMTPITAGPGPHIGTAITGMSARVLDAALRPAAPGVTGELYLAGAGLARGYDAATGSTARRFLADPYGPAGTRMYRTGDLVRRQADGTLRFVGRSDGQVKVRGFRVETGEVEAALAAHPDVDHAAVTVRETGTDAGGRLLAWVVAHHGRPPSETGLRDFVAARLPAYMVPAAVALVPHLPLTAHGKADFASLPDPRPGAAAGGAAPRTPQEEILCALFAESLGAQTVGRDDDFFALGGHSLLATHLVNRIRTAFGRELPVRALFEAPTPQELAPRLESGGTGRPALRAVSGRLARVPLSFAQRRLWFLNRMRPEDASYNIPLAVRLRGRLDTGALQAALCDVVSRHETLRTVFAESPQEAGHPRQQVLAPGDARPRLTALRCLPEQAPDLLRAAAERGFDLGRELPLRAHLLELAPQEQVLLLTLHHIAADGWSMGPLAQDLAAAYAARCAGRAPDWAPLPVQYGDYAVWQESLLGDPHDPDSVHARQLAHWRSALAGAPAELSLPTDRPRPEVSSGRGGTVPVPLAEGDLARLAELARAEGASTFMALHAVLAAALDRLGAGEDIVVGTPVAGRTDEALNALVGFFVNTLVLRVGTGGDPSLRALIARTRQADLSAYAHQDLPFESLVESLAPPRSLSRHPLFQVMLSLNNAGRPELDLPGLHAAVEGVEVGGAKFDLSFSFSEQDAAGGLSGLLEYNRDVFEAGTAQRIADWFGTLLRQAVDRPDTPLSAHDPMDAAEREKLLALGDGGSGVDRHESVVDAFRAAADSARSSDLAVRSAKESLSFAELRDSADRLARLLHAHGVSSGATVAVLLPRSAGSLVALLGVLTAGGVYAPVDETLPRERIAAVVEDARPAVVLVTEETEDRLPAGDLRTLRLDDPKTAAALAALPCGPPPGARPQALDAAYVIHTSGSTGRPKGVVVEHRSLVRLLEHHTSHLFAPAREAAGGRRMRVALTASLSFDASWDPVLWMLGGNELVVVDHDTRRDPEALVRLVREHHIDLLETTPTHAAALLDAGLCAPAKPAGQGRPPLLLALGGEPVPTSLWRRIREIPGLRAWNLYGPTEATVDTLVASLDASPHPVLGAPVTGTRAHVMDRFLRPSPLGAVGELYLAGDGVARGYLGRPGATAVRFLPDPFGPPGSRMYRTGDLVRRTADGRLHFHGRTDGQVKVRGFRVELGEIAAVLEEHPDVARAAVTLRAADDGVLGGEEHLVAYLVPAAEQVSATGPAETVTAADGPDRAELRAAVALALPDYMVPSAFVALPRLPLTTSGKLDHAALPAPGAEHLVRRTGRAARNPREDVLCALFGEVLGVERPWADDDFFALGGHSLLAARLIARVKQATGADLGIRTLFEAPTPAALAAALDTCDDADGTPSHAGGELATLLPLRARGALPPLFCVHPAGGLAWSYAGLLQHLDDGRPLYGLQTPNLAGDQPFPSSIEDMAACYVREVRAVQPHGPYHLLGWSFGGNVVQEVAVQLQEAGEQVALLAVLDAYPSPPADGLEEADHDTVFRALLTNLGLDLSAWDETEALDARDVRDSLRDAGSPLGGLEPETIQTMVGNFAAQARLMRHYTPRVFHGEVLFFRATEEDPAGGLTPGMWAPYVAGPVRLSDVPCAHAQMMRPDSRALIGDVLAEELRREP
ncbi:amino acid adenylation domain-containing protein [Streptomyces tubbatahanensis]|uniref:Amino acid adenylation domain-containing protein n=1 Tax=Streptomyces tubbatahanensis TaxID=2923272 RepID=A0ABY3Y286_9ACTN|nr:non-ribosomal peptide synthetase [Streptomyces tubbatahanensis]UNT00736.1 amino acid adenylation domain-containing protein [Streptomyces tubbatahanensis]